MTNPYGRYDQDGMPLPENNGFQGQQHTNPFTSGNQHLGGTHNQAFNPVQPGYAEPHQAAQSPYDFGANMTGPSAPTPPAYGQAGYRHAGYGQAAYGQAGHGMPVSQLNAGFYPHAPEVYSEKSKVVAALLAFFLGGIGAHNFYLGYTGRALTQLSLTFFGIVTSIIFVGVFLLMAVSVWVFVEFLLILLGSGSYAFDVAGRRLR